MLPRLGSAARRTRLKNGAEDGSRTPNGLISASW
ncbi:predicted protein [Plenodomus lingam JN3]|uniref:Predicted protein n=1 Tax=Leptosphaeria maculans (strain JN3 / isolate v23.1.3 / race Av1-4-5-6-7-8) TaxID=985895 RepID=E5A8R7_LEPMJ|nr:predicted protein [Plenodomus lingam JN3]CBY00012.1 predicted protein [Plenodomus lingam JN3]